MGGALASILSFLFLFGLLLDFLNQLLIIFLEEQDDKQAGSQPAACSGEAPLGYWGRQLAAGQHWGEAKNPLLTSRVLGLHSTHSQFPENLLPSSLRGSQEEAPLKGWNEVTGFVMAGGLLGIGPRPCFAHSAVG